VVVITRQRARRTRSRAIFLRCRRRAAAMRAAMDCPGRLVALAIKLSVIVAQRGSVGPGRDYGGLASRSQRLEDASVGVERFVGDQHIRLHRRQEVICCHEVVRFAAGQEEAERIAERIDRCMDLGAQSAARAPDCLVVAGFFWAPALC
jgi:hypothetical protein